MSSLKQTVEKALQAILSLPVGDATKAKVVVIGSDGCARHMDVSLTENS